MDSFLSATNLCWIYGIGAGVIGGLGLFYNVKSRCKNLLLKRQIECEKKVLTISPILSYPSGSH
jgi:hypothetical protein